MTTATTTTTSSAAAATTADKPFRHPVVAVSHGPGPLWLLDEGFAGQNKHSPAAQNLRSVFRRIYGDHEASHLPKRILFVTAHWESSMRNGFEISKSASPTMIYDYGGFPRESYEVVYRAKGDPAFAERVASALAQHDIPARTVERGFDHGVFVPMFLIRPDGDIPVVSLSINDRLSAKDHFALGRALAPLRDEDTLIICSGQATHNLRASRAPTTHVEEWAQGFQDWMDRVLTGAEPKLSLGERVAQLEAWEARAPFARMAHPSPDHFSPFVVAAGVGMADAAQPDAEKVLSGWGMGHMSFATYAWGVAK